MTLPNTAAGAGQRDEPKAAPGAAMIPYTIAKEVNSDHAKASTAGAMNFLVFTFSAVLGPVFGLALLQRLSGGEPLTLVTLHLADAIWVDAIVLALILTFLLRETDAEARPTPLAAPTRAS